MKKYIKIAVVTGIGLLSTAVVAEQSKSSDVGFVDSVCSVFPTACTMSTQGNGGGREIPDQPKSKDKK